MMNMTDFDFVPTHLRMDSISKNELVLPLAQALAVVDFLAAAKWGLNGWEGWVQYPTGIGHHQDYQGTVSLEPRPNETWESFVKWSAQFCKQTMLQSQASFGADPNCRDLHLFFCLSSSPPPIE